MDTALTNGVIIAGIVTTLLILWFSLRRYEGYFSEKKLFLSFLAGIAVGFVVVVLEFLTSGVSIVIAIIAFPLIEQLSKLMILNYKVFRGGKDTPIYGLAVGLGFGAIFIPISTLVALKGQTLDIASAVAAFLAGFALIFLHGATGSVVGYGVGYMEGEKKWKYFVLAVLITVPARLILIAPIKTLYVASSILLIYALIFYLYVTFKFLVLALPRKERKRRKR